MKIWHETCLPNTPSTALLGLAVLALLIALLLSLMQGPAFGFKRIRIEGANGASLKHVHPDAIRQGVLPRLRGNYFTIDRRATACAFEDLPWVRKASVRRAWPNALIVTLEEHQVAEDCEPPAANGSRTMRQDCQCNGTIRLDDPLNR